MDTLWEARDLIGMAPNELVPPPNMCSGGLNMDFGGKDGAVRVRPGSYRVAEYLPTNITGMARFQRGYYESLVVKDNSGELNLCTDSVLSGVDLYTNLSMGEATDGLIVDTTLNEIYLDPNYTGDTNPYYASRVYQLTRKVNPEAQSTLTINSNVSTSGTVRVVFYTSTDGTTFEFAFSETVHPTDTSDVVDFFSDMTHCFYVIIFDRFNDNDYKVTGMTLDFPTKHSLITDLNDYAGVKFNLGTGSISKQIYGESLILGTGTPTGGPAIVKGKPAVAYRLGVTPPPTAPSGAPDIAGVLNGDYQLRVTYVNDDGTESNASPASTTETVVNEQIIWTIPVDSAAANEGRITKRRLYRTKAGGSAFYFLAEVANNTATTYQDNIGDSSLVELMEDDNTRPPNGAIVHIHKNILFVVSDSDRSKLWFSKVGGYFEGSTYGGFGSFPTTYYKEFPADIKALATYGGELIVSGESFTYEISGSIFGGSLDDTKVKLISSFGATNNESAVECLDQQLGSILVLGTRSGAMMLRKGYDNRIDAAPFSEPIKSIWETVPEHQKDEQAMFYLDGKFYWRLNGAKVKDLIYWQHGSSEKLYYANYDEYPYYWLIYDFRTQAWWTPWTSPGEHFLVVNGEIYGSHDRAISCWGSGYRDYPDPIGISEFDAYLTFPVRNDERSTFLWAEWETDPITADYDEWYNSSLVLNMNVDGVERVYGIRGRPLGDLSYTPGSYGMDAYVSDASTGMNGPPDYFIYRSHVQDSRVVKKIKIGLRGQFAFIAFEQYNRVAPTRFIPPFKTYSLKIKGFRGEK